MLASYERLQSAEGATKLLLPNLLHDLQPDEAWVKAVAERNQAHEAFVSAAKAYCSGAATKHE